jgi:hypothetical protein
MPRLPEGVWHRRGLTPVTDLVNGSLTDRHAPPWTGTCDASPRSADRARVLSEVFQGDAPRAPEATGGGSRRHWRSTEER